MKQLPPVQKQSLKELLQYALTMPVGDLAKYGTLFLSGPVPASMTRGELIALQLVERASYGDLDAVKELRAWVAEDPKRAEAPGAGTTYYQFLINLAGGGQVPAESLPDAAKSLQALAKAVEQQTAPVIIPAEPVDAHPTKPMPDLKSIDRLL